MSIKPKGPKCNWCEYHTDVLRKHQRWLKEFWKLVVQLNPDIDDGALGLIMQERLEKLRKMLP